MLYGVDMVRPRLISPVFVLALAFLVSALSAHAASVIALVRPREPMFQPGEESPAEKMVFPTIQSPLDHAPWPAARHYPHCAGRLPRAHLGSAEPPQRRVAGVGKMPAGAVIVSDHYAKESGGIFFTETAEIVRDGVIADNVTFDNSARPVGQALAASVLAETAPSSSSADFWATRTRCLPITDGSITWRTIFREPWISSLGTLWQSSSAAKFNRLSPDALQLKVGSVSFRRPETGPGTAKSRWRQGENGRYVGLGRPWHYDSRVFYLNTRTPTGILPQGFGN